MIPSSPHSVTIGTGVRRMRAIVFLRLGGQLSIWPSDVAAQLKFAMIPAASPPPLKNGWRAVVITFKTGSPTSCCWTGHIGDVVGHRRQTHSLIVNGAFL